MRQDLNGSTRLRVPEDWEIEQAISQTPKRILTMIECWNEYGGVPFDIRKKTKGNLKTIQALRQLVAGTYYDDKPGLTPWSEHRFTVDDFRRSVKRFSHAAFSTPYLPKYKEPLRKLTLQRFLYAYGAKNPIARSYFITYYENPPELKEPLPTEKNKAVTNRLIYHYKADVLGDLDYEIMPNQRRPFIQSANKLLNFVESKNGKFYGGMKDPDFVKMADYLWESIKTKNKNRIGDITPYWFGSEYTFENFRKFLNKAAILRKQPSRGPRIGQPIVSPRI